LSRDGEEFAGCLGQVGTPATDSEDFGQVGGVRWTPCREASLVLAGGYAFEQECSGGFDSRENVAYVELSDAPFIRLGLEAMF